MKHEEFKLQQQVCKYLNLKHPHILFYSDTIASVKLTEFQAYRNKTIQKEGFKLPDLIIFYPSKEYKALFIELKIKSPFKKNGEIYKDEHLEGQQRSINDLSNLGYYATFSVGYEQTIQIIEDYLNENL